MVLETVGAIQETGAVEEAVLVTVLGIEETVVVEEAVPGLVEEYKEEEKEDLEENMEREGMLVKI